MFREIINESISKLKGTEYILDEKIEIQDIIEILFEKIVDYLRGIIKKVGIKGSRKKMFIGKRTKLTHKSHIHCGNGVQIKDYVEINGLCKDGVIIGDNSSIGRYTIIRGTGSFKKLGVGIKIGRNFGCGDFCFFGCSGGIEIGDNVIMGQNVRLHSQNHNFKRYDIPIKDQGVVSKGIKIGRNCWIGSGSVILDGVTIGEGCVIGANSVVTKDISDNMVVIGYSAKELRQR